MEKKIRVVILDDHPMIVEGYLSKLGKDPQIEVTATLHVAEELDATLNKQDVDVLLLDVSVPISLENRNPYPILHVIPALLESHPNLNILVISMHAERGIIRGVMEAGSSGYILKDDPAANQNLAVIIKSVAAGGIYFSTEAYDLYAKHVTLDHEGELSPRQLEALSLCLSYPGAKNTELADKMKIKHSTFRNFLSGAYIKLGVSNRTEAIAKARKMGLITPNEPEAAKTQPSPHRADETQAGSPPRK